MNLCSSPRWVRALFPGALILFASCQNRGISTGTESKQASGSASAGDNSRITNVTLQWAGKNAGMMGIGTIGLAGSLGALWLRRQERKVVRALATAVERHEPLGHLKRDCAAIAQLHRVNKQLDRELVKLGFRKKGRN